MLKQSFEALSVQSSVFLVINTVIQLRNKLIILHFLL